jgi:hypothetical protein
MQTTEINWTKTDECLPKEGELVQTMNSNGYVQPLKRRGRLWFYADDFMYVYYTPTMWKPISNENGY